jgi:phospholipase/carboxylesterase
LAPRILDGPRRPAASGRARALGVLCHGYGANGDDLIALAGAWAEVLPDVAFAAPHAPDPSPGAPGGRQWFGLTELDPRELAAGAGRVVPDLQHFIDRELVRLAIAPGALVLIGFSQGTMMALAAGLSRAPSPAAILGYSGALVAPPRTAEPPPVFLVHGDADEVLPVGASFAAFETLAAGGVPVVLHTRPELGHGIDEAGLFWGGRFLAAALAGELAGALRPVALEARGSHKIA